MSGIRGIEVTKSLFRVDVAGSWYVGGIVVVVYICRGDEGAGLANSNRCDNCCLKPDS